MKPSATISVILLILLATVGFYFFGTPAPKIRLIPETGAVAARKQMQLQLSSKGGILQQVSVSVKQGDRAAGIMLKKYLPGVKEVTETFDLAQSGLQEGPFTLQVEARGSAAHFGATRTRTNSYSFTYENKPPNVAVLTTAHNIIRGGAALVVYNISKEVEKTGVLFGDRFYQGYRQSGNRYACFFPFPWDMEPSQYVPRVVAIDHAGNERLMGINYHLISKTFTSDRINLSETLFEKVKAEFGHRYPQAASPLELFLKVNGELRQQDRRALVEYGKKTSPVPLWQGVFLRMPNAAPLGGFAQTRSYMYEGKEVDKQTHLGFDLASLAQAPIPAANTGKVVYAGDLGLYGQCVIIDHGVGLQTLYGHMSNISVKEGDSVQKGQTIGNTGATGMALGDHLHFEVLISGQAVNPIEWWDAKWITNNVTGKLQVIGR